MTLENLTPNEYLVIVDINDEAEVKRAANLEYAYCKNFENGLFLIFNQDKTEDLPYCQFAINVDFYKNVGKTQIELKKSANKFAWQNRFVGTKVFAELGNVDKNVKDSRLVYHVNMKENNLFVNDSFRSGFVELDECTVIK